MSHDKSKQSEIIEIINQDLCNIINTKNDPLLYVFMVLIYKYGYIINYEYILEELLKTNRFNTITKLCKLTYLNITVKANIEKIRKYISDEKYINNLLVISKKINKKLLMQKLTLDNYDSYLIILNYLKYIAKSYSYLRINIIKLLNLEQTQDTSIIYLYYELLHIPVNIILNFTFSNSYLLSSNIFKFNYDYCFDIIATYEKQYPNILNENHFYIFDENILNDAFNGKYLDNLQNKSIFHHMIENECYLRNLKKQRCN